MSQGPGHTQQNFAENAYDDSRRLGSRARQRAGRTYGHIKEGVSTHPAASVMSVFAAGFGIGLLLGYALGERTPFHRADDKFAEKFARRILDSISGIVPDSFSGRFGSR